MTKGTVTAALAAGMACVCMAGTEGPRMDRSKLLIGAYSFNKSIHDEAHVREAKERGIDFVLGVHATDRDALDRVHVEGAELV